MDVPNPLVFFCRCKPCGVDAIKLALDFNCVFIGYTIGKAGCGYDPIRPYGEGGEHEARNGLLLRRDIHSLFDAGYVTVTPERRFEVSRRHCQGNQVELVLRPFPASYG